MIVVLPFENLGRPEDEYFADGISDEITARLARISGLGVIARTSAMQYKGSKKSVRDIGEELGVDYILEGTVRWEHLADAPSRVRVTPKLVRASDATHLWAEVYEEPLAGVFRIQSGIAERVAEATDLTLPEPERRALRAAPTGDLDAYDDYLRGNEYHFRSYRQEDFEIARRMYERAVERDPNFALAHAQLSVTHSLMYWFHHDRSEERLARAKAAVDQALALDPTLPEAHLALGLYYYRGHLDYDRALAEMEIARKGMPGSADVMLALGSVRRRQGRWDQAIEDFRAAVRLDPRSAWMNLNHGETYSLVRDYPEARHYLERATSLTPEWGEAYVGLARVHLAQEGATRRARAVLEGGSRIPSVAGDRMVVHEQLVLDLLDRDFEGLLDRLETVSWTVFYDQYEFQPTALLHAYASAGMGRADLAREHYDSARALLEQEIREHPDDSRLHSALGIAYAGLGLREEAIRAGRRGVELLPIEREAWRGAYRVEELARIQAMVGEHDAAIENLDLLLSRPSQLSVARLRLDPAWDPLRDHPRFKKLLEEYL
ncbi:MAG: tetratricopeptide repeat protein [Acidobacteria bacterium]|nr:tetratricopeptide repeat protein [Acidobacteriota bacterium]